jgi:hypothetical protein
MCVFGTLDSLPLKTQLVGCHRVTCHGRSDFSVGGASTLVTTGAILIHIPTDGVQGSLKADQTPKKAKGARGVLSPYTALLLDSGSILSSPAKEGSCLSFQVPQLG